jgi:hypothetical protein
MFELVFNLLITIAVNFFRQMGQVFFVYIKIEITLAHLTRQVEQKR